MRPARRGAPPGDRAARRTRAHELHRHRRGARPRRSAPVGAGTSTTRTRRWSARTWSPSSPRRRWTELADPSIAYVYADTPRRTPFGRCLEVDRRAAVLAQAAARRAARARVGRLEILKRGSALEPEQLRRDLRLAGDAAASLVLTRVAGAPTVLRRAAGGRLSSDSPAGRGRVSMRHGETGHSGDRAAHQAEGRRTALHPYDVSPDAPNYGALVAAALGVAPERVFKTLVAEVDGALTVAVVPVTGELDLKALAARGRRQAGRAGRPRGRRADHRLRPRRHQPAGPAQRLPTVSTTRRWTADRSTSPPAAAACRSSSPRRPDRPHRRGDRARSPPADPAATTPDRGDCRIGDRRDVDGERILRRR